MQILNLCQADDNTLCRLTCQQITKSLNHFRRTNVKTSSCLLLTFVLLLTGCKREVDEVNVFLQNMTLQPLAVRFTNKCYFVVQPGNTTIVTNVPAIRTCYVFAFSQYDVENSKAFSAVNTPYQWLRECDPSPVKYKAFVLDMRAESGGNPFSPGDDTPTIDVLANEVEGAASASVSKAVETQVLTGRAIDRVRIRRVGG
jgi:hypothetical protein